MVAQYIYFALDRPTWQEGLLRVAPSPGSQPRPPLPGRVPGRVAPRRQPSPLLPGQRWMPGVSDWEISSTLGKSQCTLMFIDTTIPDFCLILWSYNTESTRQYKFEDSLHERVVGWQTAVTKSHVQPFLQHEQKYTMHYLILLKRNAPYMSL